jgi:hypothetical protein
VRLLNWFLLRYLFRVDEDLLDEMVAGIDAEAERQAERS